MSVIDVLNVNYYASQQIKDKIANKSSNLRHNYN